MTDYPIEQCCFATGHRSMPQHQRRNILLRIRLICLTLMEKGVRHFYVGGANGFDQWVAVAVIKLRELDPTLTLHVLLPDKDYTWQFSPEEKLLQEDILSQADEVVTVPARGGREPALVRDDELVRRGAYCICYLRDHNLTRRGGTAYTLRRAREANRICYSVFSAEDYNLPAADAGREEKV